jgi:phosphonate transport system substrate-binding protein
MHPKTMLKNPLNRIRLRLPLFLLLLFFGQQYSIADEQKTIRFGILSIAQPARIFASWQPFADYMSQQLGQPVEIVVPRGFGKMKKTISEGKVDFFYINSLVFYRLKQEGKAVAVAQMQNIAGQTTSRSDIFVKRDSGIDSIDDLKDKNIAFVSPMGAGGYLAPRAFLYEFGLESGIETRESFTKNLSNTIHGVLLGDYDAGTMCGVNYKLMSKKIETGELKVIAISEEYPENVIGARNDLPEKQVQQFRDALLNMTETTEGKTILQDMQKMKIKSFIKYDEAMEAITERLLKTGKL